MNSLIIGAGEVGRGLYDIMRQSRSHDVVMIDVVAREGVETEAQGSFPMMHICFGVNLDDPASRFVEHVLTYAERYRPLYIVIHSTVRPGTTRLLQQRFKQTLVVHAPVEGRHQDFAQSMKLWVKPLGAVYHQLGHMAYLGEVAHYFADLGIPTRISDGGPEATELCKIWSTTMLGLQVAFTHHAAQSLQAAGADYGEFARYLADYNHLYSDLGLPQFVRPILQPPNGPIGGHCVMPNMELVDDEAMASVRKFIRQVNDSLKVGETDG